MHLYSIDHKADQEVPGFAPYFMSYLVNGNSAPFTLFCRAYRDLQHGDGITRLYVAVVGQPEKYFTKRVMPVAYNEDVPQDYPFAIQEHNGSKLLILLTTYGYVHLYDAIGGTYLRAVERSVSGCVKLFIATPDTQFDGIVAVDMSGQVWRIRVDENSLVSFVRNVLKKDDAAVATAQRRGLPGAEEPIFEKLCREMKFFEAATYAATEPTVSRSR